MAILGLAFLAGILSILSPCVLPLLPVILAAAVSQHRYGPAALAAGLAISFVAIGLFVATIGFSIGIDSGVLRTAAALLMIGIGLVLVVPGFQVRLALAGGPVANWAERRFGGFSPAGLQGQFGVGLAARRRLESMRWADAGRGLAARSAGQEFTPSRTHDAFVRPRGCGCHCWYWARFPAKFCCGFEIGFC